MKVQVVLINEETGEVIRQSALYVGKNANEIYESVKETLLYYDESC